MMFYELLLIGATVLYSAQFIFLKFFQRQRGTGLASSSAFSGGAAAAQFLILLCANGFHLSSSPFSLGAATLYAASLIGMNLVGIQALRHVSLSLYTLFSMLGGMILPVLYGLCLNESMTPAKASGMILITASLLTAVRESGKPGLAGALCCAGVFLLNGCFGILTKWHQSSPLAVPSLDFMLLYNLIAAALSALLIAVCRRPLPLTEGHGVGTDGENQSSGKGLSLPAAALPPKTRILSWGSAAAYAAVNGGAQLIALLCAQHLDASVQYPVVTGGCVLFSLLTGLLFGERATLLALVRAVLAVGGTLLFLF